MGSTESKSSKLAKKSKSSKSRKKIVTKRRNSQSIKQILIPARKVAIRILADILDTQEIRKEVGAQVNRTLRGMNAIFYEDKGSFEMIAAAIVVAYKLDEASLGDLGVRIRTVFRQQTPNAQIDHAWQEMDKYYTSKEKMALLAAMQTFADMRKNGQDSSK